MAVRNSTISPFLSLRYKQFRYLWIVQLSTITALMMDMVSRGWLAYDMTGSAAHLALVTATRAIPLLFFGLIAGVLVDLFNRRKLLMISQYTNLILNLLTCVLILTGWLHLWMLYTSSLLAGMAMAVQQPARNSMMPLTVPKESLQNAVVLNASTHNIGQAVGPVICGFLIAGTGVASTFFAQAILFILSIWLTGRMSAEVANAPVRMPGTEKETFRQSLIEGFSYVRRNKNILGLLILALVPMFFANSLQNLMPIFAEEILLVGPKGVGILLGSMGVGSIASMLVLLFLPAVRNSGRVVIVSASLFSLFVLLFALSELFWQSIVLIFFAGCCRSVFRTMNHSILSKNTKKEYLGRVNSIYMLDRGLVPLGTVVTGLVAELANVAYAVAIMSFLSIIIGLSTLLFSTSLWNADKKKENSVSSSTPEGPLVDSSLKAE